MQVILKADVRGQGKKGQLVNVSDGFARNFLFPKGLAVEANAANLNEIKQKASSDAHKLQQNRERARNNWEVTQVNELLHQMENFNGIMVGATNFLRNLDPAVLRRFTYKLGFDYLDNTGKKIFFERMFKTKLSFGELKRLDAIENLTPGDFRTVRQSLYYLDATSNELRLSSLEQESRIKIERANPESNSGDKKKIGFC